MPHDLHADASHREGSAAEPLATGAGAARAIRPNASVSDRR